MTTTTGNPDDHDEWKSLMPLDSGGVLRPNLNPNLSARPEAVFTEAQFRAMEGVLKPPDEPEDEDES